jgi:hypothetical protein
VVSAGNEDCLLIKYSITVDVIGDAIAVHVADRDWFGWSCLGFVDTCKLWREGVYDAEKSPSLPAGAAA